MNPEFTRWRDFDLTPRLEKLKRAFRHEPLTCAEDLPLHINTPTYFSFGSRGKPADYYTNPASMYSYQAEGYARHLAVLSVLGVLGMMITFNVVYTVFSTPVRKRLEMYFHHGIPCWSAEPFFSREPRTTSASPATIGAMICGTSVGSYW